MCVLGRLKLELNLFSVVFKVKLAVLKLPIKLRWKFKRDEGKEGSEEAEVGVKVEEVVLV